MTLAIAIPAGAAPATEDAARAFLRALGAEEPAVQRREAAPATKDGGLALAAVILALPGAAVALLDLGERRHSLVGRRAIRERIEPSFEGLLREPGVTLTLGDRQVVLKEASVDDVLDALAAYEASIRTEGP